MFCLNIQVFASLERQVGFSPCIRMTYSCARRDFQLNELFHIIITDPFLEWNSKLSLPDEPRQSLTVVLFE